MLRQPNYLSFAYNQAVSRIYSSRYLALNEGVEVSIAGAGACVARLESVLKVSYGASSGDFGSAFSIRIRGGEQEYFGFGHDACQTVALQKALAEGFERLVYRKAAENWGNVSTSNGWAAHPIERIAKRKAAFELFERDALLVHWLRKTPFLEVSGGLARNLDPSWIKYMMDLGWSQGRLLVGFDGYLPVAVAVFGKPCGRAVASAATCVDFLEATRKAAIECVQIAAYAATAQRMQESMGLLNTKPASGNGVQPIDHALVYVYHRPFPEEMIGSCLSYQDGAERWQAAVSEGWKQHATKLRFKKATNYPLTVVRAESPEVQDLFFGNSGSARNLSKINVQRITNGKKFNIHCEFPHFLA